MSGQDPDISAFDIAQAVGLEPQSPTYEQHKLALSLQLLAYVLGRIVEDNPQLDKKVEDYKQEFIDQVKHGK